MNKEPPWWAASQNADLYVKIDDTYTVRTAKDLLELPGLERVTFMKHGNQGGNYFRFFGYFKDDPQRYFTIFDAWDLDVPFFDCKVGQELSIRDTRWKVISSEMNGFLLEVQKIE
jgi:hypothetical protein